jgi:hypothetical protein
VPRAGLADPARELLRAAVNDAEIVARFRAKVRVIPGSPCSWWHSALSGRGHGRFWLGHAGGRDVVVIAHRFAFALEHGVDALEAAPMLGHRCDNPLCQRVGTGHVVASDPWRNRQEWLMRRHTIGGALRDARGARGRARAVRDALRADPSPAALQQALRAGLLSDAAQLSLWDAPESDDLVEVTEQLRVADGPTQPGVRPRFARPVPGPRTWGAGLRPV